MAARRLLAVMLVFLAISTVLAALAPSPVERERQMTTTTTKKTTTEPDPPGPGGGELIRRRIELRQARSGLEAKSGEIGGSVGDQLVLLVAAPRVVTIVIPSLGLTETAGPFDPARFDLFLNAPGSHALVVGATNRTIARIRVRP